MMTVNNLECPFFREWEKRWYHVKEERPLWGAFLYKKDKGGNKNGI